MRDYKIHLGNPLYTKWDKTKAVKSVNSKKGPPDKPGGPGVDDKEWMVQMIDVLNAQVEAERNGNFNAPPLPPQPSPSKKRKTGKSKSSKSRKSKKSSKNHSILLSKKTQPQPPTSSSTHGGATYVPPSRPTIPQIPLPSNSSSLTSSRLVTLPSPPPALPLPTDHRVDSRTSPNPLSLSIETSSRFLSKPAKENHNVRPPPRPPFPTDDPHPAPSTKSPHTQQQRQETTRNSQKDPQTPANTQPSPPLPLPFALPVPVPIEQNGTRASPGDSLSPPEAPPSPRNPKNQPKEHTKPSIPTLHSARSASPPLRARFPLGGEVEEDEDEDEKVLTEIETDMGEGRTSHAEHYPSTLAYQNVMETVHGLGRDMGGRMDRLEKRIGDFISHVDLVLTHGGASPPVSHPNPGKVEVDEYDQTPRCRVAAHEDLEADVYRLEERERVLLRSRKWWRQRFFNKKRRSDDQNDTLQKVSDITGLTMMGEVRVGESEQTRMRKSKGLFTFLAVADPKDGSQRNKIMIALDLNAGLDECLRQKYIKELNKEIRELEMNREHIAAFAIAASICLMSKS